MLRFQSSWRQRAGKSIPYAARWSTGHNPCPFQPAPSPAHFARNEYQQRTIFKLGGKSIMATVADNTQTTNPKLVTNCLPSSQNFQFKKAALGKAEQDLMSWYMLPFFLLVRDIIKRKLTGWWMEKQISSGRHTQNKGAKFWIGCFEGTRGVDDGPWLLWSTSDIYAAGEPRKELGTRSYEHVYCSAIVA